MGRAAFGQKLAFAKCCHAYIGNKKIRASNSKCRRIIKMEQADLWINPSCSQMVLDFLHSIYCRVIGIYVGASSHAWISSLDNLKNICIAISFFNIKNLSLWLVPASAIITHTYINSGFETAFLSKAICLFCSSSIFIFIHKSALVGQLSPRDVFTWAGSVWVNCQPR